MKQTVRKAVIPVAGLGTRFLPATKAQPKEMLPVFDKPGVQYAVEEAVAAGIEDIIFVTGASKRAIEDHFDSNPELEARLRQSKKTELLKSVQEATRLANFIYVRQSEPRGTSDAVLRAEPIIGDEPFVMIWPDNFILSKENGIAKMIEVFNEYGAPVIGVIRVPKRDVSKYGIIENKHIKGRIHEVVRFIEKPAVDKAPSTLASQKGYVLTAEIFSYLKRKRAGVGGEQNLPDAVTEYNRKHAVFAYEFEGEFYDLGSKTGWLKANVAVGFRHPEIRTEFRRFLKSLMESS